MQIDVDPEQEFHVVLNGAVRALSLDGLAELYQADSIGDATLIWQEGFTDWMRLDALLAALDEQEEPHEDTVSSRQPAPDPNKYQVQFAPDDIKSVPLPGLVDAHRLGVVDDDTLVKEPGSDKWVPLAVIIATFSLQARQHTAPSAAPVTNTAPSPSSAYSAPIRSTPPMSQAPNTLAPTAANVGAEQVSFPPNAAVPSGLDDLDLHAFQSSRSPWAKRSAIGVGALAAVFGIYQLASDPGGEGAAQPVSAAAPHAASIPSPEVDAEPSAWEKEQALLEEARRKDEAALAQAAKSPTANAFGDSLSGEPKAKTAAPSPARSKSQPKAKKSSTPGQAGSLQYDPMNGAL